jgi:hypothetical protein
MGVKGAAESRIVIRRWLDKLKFVTQMGIKGAVES